MDILRHLKAGMEFSQTPCTLRKICGGRYRSFKSIPSEFYGPLRVQVEVEHRVQNKCILNNRLQDKLYFVLLFARQIVFCIIVCKTNVFCIIVCNTNYILYDCLQAKLYFV